jgi:predicted acyl esterase
MALPAQDIYSQQVVEAEGKTYVFEKNVNIPLATGHAAGGLIRANVYRPNQEGKFPVLVTYGPCMLNYLVLSWSILITS